METLEDYEAFVALLTLLNKPEDWMRKKASVMETRGVAKIIEDTEELAEIFCTSDIDTVTALGEKMLLYVEICKVELTARIVGKEDE